METITSQNKSIKAHLQKGKSLTALDALYMFGCFRLGARIHDLKAQGLKFKSELIEITSAGKKKKVSKYSIIK